MRPWPRVLAFTDDAVASRDDFGVRAAAFAAAGPAAAIVARLPAGTADRLAALTGRVVALAAPPMAAVWVTGRADVALACGAQGVVTRRDDLAPADVRRLAGDRLVRVASIHSRDEAERAMAGGAEALVAGMIWPSPTHPGRAAAGLDLIEQVAPLGAPVYAIGGVSPERAGAVRDAGAWGVAAIRAVWDAPDSYRAALTLLAPWQAT